MLREMKRQLVLNYSGYLVALAVCLFFALFTGTLFAALGAMEDEPVLISLSTIFFYAGICISTWVLTLSNLGYRFNMALKMGALRKQYVPAVIIISWVFCFVVLLFGNLLFLADKGVAAFYGIQLEDVFSMTLPWAAGLATASTALGSWSGAMLMRHGKAGFWVIWVLWVLPGMLNSVVNSALNEQRTDAFARFVQRIAAAVTYSTSVSIIVGIAAAAVVLGAIAAHTFFMLHKVQAQE